MNKFKNLKNVDTAVIVGNSKFKLNLLNIFSDKFPIYAVDGGANKLVKNNIKFESVIGDMDSIKKSLIKNKNLKINKIPDQDSTDLQKCLKVIKFRNIFGLGFLDKRLDHTLATLTAISGDHFAKKIVLVGKYDVLIWVKGGWSCQLPTKTRVSIWPIGKQIFRSSKGLKWSLDGLVMEPKERIGTSNETISKEITIIPKDPEISNYFTLFPVSCLEKIMNNFKSTEDTNL